MARSQGLGATWERVRERLADQVPLGYSAVGEVVEVDDAGSPFAVGQVLACVGAGVANHAEYLAVPTNLAVPVPSGVPAEQAAFAAIGCIAMQGIRRLEIEAGEWVGVIGLGLVGQVTVRLARAMGYRVWATDPLPERVAMAQAVGATACILAEASGVHQVHEVTEGRGLDGVVVCAATASNEPVNFAFDLCRQRGKVSVVGNVGLGLQREKMYRKELELRMSMSYGPGRYDPSYEFEGRDYPYGLVRWTERRNLELFVALLADGRLDVGSLVTARYPIDAASEAYARVRAGAPTDCAVLFEYPRQKDAAPVRAIRAARPSVPAPGVGPVRLALIGAGDYVKAMHLPNLRRLSTLFALAGVASRTGTAAAVVARRYGIPLVATDYREVLEDPAIEAVLVSTRHATHAAIAQAALDAGKHVYLEKPLSLTVDDGLAVCRAAERAGRVLRVGFNRRFSPWLLPLRGVLRAQGRRAVSIRVNVGHLGEHWSNHPAEGGRLLGEGVHFFDLATWLLGIEPDRVHARFLGTAEPANPDALVELGYPDGSAATVLYTTQGAPAMGKERVEVFGGGASAFCDDYRDIGVFGTVGPRHSMTKGDKGQLGALQEFAAAIRGHPSGESAGGWDGLLATRIALAAIQSAARGEPVAVASG
jgi:predicted dehydrogenase/threonine dehydrogenase-like Zn-dependent dehydrogenase